MPDNRHMVMANRPSLWLVDTRTESMTRLDDGTHPQNDPAVSPDGKHLLLNRWTPFAHLFELPLDGSPPRKLLATTRVEFDPSWSRKGDQFAFVREQRPFHRELWVYSSQGEWDRPVVTPRVLPEGSLVSAPDISPDGTRVAYLVTFNQRSGIYVSPLTGGTPTLLVPNAVSAPSWSPDGTSIALLWEPRGVLSLGIYRLGVSQQPVEIPDLPAPCRTSPVWSPSGEWIACGAQSGQNGPLPVTPLLVSPDGNRKRLLKPINALMLAWGRDSRTLYGLDWRSGRMILSAEDIASGAVRNVADYGPGLNVFLNWTSGRMSLSPDGKSFAVGLSKGPSIQSDLWLLDGFAK
jgi:Tol biopolymer transport system component